MAQPFSRPGLEGFRVFILGCLEGWGHLENRGAGGTWLAFPGISALVGLLPEVRWLKGMQRVGRRTLGPC